MALSAETQVPSSIFVRPRSTASAKEIHYFFGRSRATFVVRWALLVVVRVHKLAVRLLQHPWFTRSALLHRRARLIVAIKPVWILRSTRIGLPLRTFCWRCWRGKIRPFLLLEVLRSRGVHACTAICIVLWLWNSLLVLAGTTIQIILCLRRSLLVLRWSREVVDLGRP